MMLFKIGAALLGAAFVNAALYSNTSQHNHTCVLQTPVTSCSVKSLDLANVDSCCSETFGGLVLSTQFWDTHTGEEENGQLLPQKHWTLHGLWPDFCNGSFTQYCDLNRQYDPSPSPNTTNGEPDGTPVPAWKGPGVDTFIEDWGRKDLLDFMNTFWVSQGSPNKDFWAHEFSKHGTCYSTFDIPCYGPKYRKNEDLIEFYETAIKFYRELPTYDWLAAEGITPSNKTAYSLSDITNALKKHYGATPHLGCSGPSYSETDAGKGSNDHGRTVLTEVWYFNHVTGRVQDANATHIDSTTDTSCSSADGAIWYYERASKSEQDVSDKEF
ncbi:RNA endonuclease [Malassezia pachydermatis]|uniref:ribonuclease T2 n=1 Tax=Malassezia pachydermatis TaxID=77020 RepID=A0A0M8MLC0_9BASI|nr:ribonuclease t2 [Malassezia pachydermatis]KOS12417.1 ribonuclease t2 [Malassezia pachydermatis]